jgi:hypothetical protein
MLKVEFFSKIEMNKSLRAIGMCCTLARTNRSVIRLDPTWVPPPTQKGLVVPPNSALNPISMSRLGTLLHEICHAFLDVHACSACPEYLAEVRQMYGHGFAWQRIALMVELSARDRLGMNFCLGRFSALQCNWRDLRVWPTLCEAQSWRLSN